MKRGRAFTLIEILVVATIFSFMALGIATTFFTGMRIWGRAQNTDFAQYNNLLTLEVIARELRQSVRLPAIGFTVKKDEFSFPTLVGNSIVKVTYKFDAEAKTLLRQQKDLETVFWEKDPEKGFKQKEEQQKLVMTSLEELSLSYFYSYFDPEQGSNIYVMKEVKADEDAWSEDKGIYLAIRLNAKIKGADFAKTILIPIS